MPTVNNIGQTIIKLAQGENRDSITNQLREEKLSDQEINEIFDSIRKDELLEVKSSALIPSIDQTIYILGAKTVTTIKEYLSGISKEKTSFAINQVESVTAASDLSGNSVTIKQQGEQSEIKIEHISLEDIEKVQQLYKYIMEAQKSQSKS